MKYIKPVEGYKTKKKVISTRVTEILIKALETAKPEMPHRFDFTFSIPEIIDKAFEDALDEIKVATGGYDFYELEKFKYYIRYAKERYGVEDTTLIDPDKEAHKILVAYTELRYGEDQKNQVEMSYLTHNRRSEIEEQLAEEAGL
ncbi:hypothetical protein SP60_05005 [Candidatus Thioglobus autotrophicus]|jgi:hypothetical protein|uniref:Uncharacterized protein n=1 Tax=Candidatus Thioglobus autotrophicus TaxID=1705394 RepID=A0A0M4NTV6_9GAMM|nr:hypothetical protein [Candidatus Thioglobus autotrophicus]ALE52619.1 hypothetical protein SP60_05005 [Candidatus Thioglobus autotrophicus]